MERDAAVRHTLVTVLLLRFIAAPAPAPAPAPTPYPAPQYDLTFRLLRTSEYYSQSGLTIPASGPLKEEEVVLGKLLYR